METYRINGVEVEYDTFDLVNLELFQQEAAALSRRANEIRIDETGDPAAFLREMCEGVLDFFDLVVGEGTARKCFGTRPNVKTLTEAFRQFVADVSAETAAFRLENGGEDGPFPAAPAAPPMNREQRRAAERARKRQEAEERLRQRRQD